TTMSSGCSSMDGANGPRGPRLVSGGYSNEYEQYAEVGIEFSSVGDLMAVISPSRWQSPIKTGGSLSWVNPNAWSDDAGRTGRILLGEAVIVGGAVAAVAVGSSGGSDSGSTAPASGVLPPSPGTPPPTPF
ncbi:MAG: hypothetical protein V3V05_00805, partial [Pontiella sp.]